MNWMYALGFWVASASLHDADAQERSAQSRTPLDAQVRDAREGRWIRHVVQRRESLDQIASRFGVGPEDILDRRRNPLPSSSIKSGQVLWIPASSIPVPRQRRRLWVAERSTWSELAQTYSTPRHPLDAGQLRSENPRFSRYGTVPPRKFISIWADSGVRPVPASPPLGSAAADDDDVAAGGLSIGRPQVGRLRHGIQLPPGDGYVVLFPDSAWGTTLAIKTVRQAIEMFRARSGYGGVLQVGAISRRKGGKFPPHRSHQSGRDVDIRLPAMPFAEGQMHLRADEVDWHAAWLLLKAFEDTGVVQAIFLDQKHQRRVSRAGIRMGATDEELEAVMGKVTHAPGHRGHLHIRIRCSTDAERCKG